MRLRPRLTYANVMSTIAVFIALGGVSYAVTSLPSNSVGTRQIKRHAVTGSKLAAHSVSTSKLATGTLAPNSARLGGRSPAAYLVHCPAGTAPALGQCFETVERAAADWYGAVEACQSIGRRLPWISELESLKDMPAFNVNSAEISGNATVVYYDAPPGSNVQSYLVGGALAPGFSSAPVTTPNRFRCAVAPGN